VPAVVSLTADLAGRALEHIDDGLAVVDDTGTIVLATARFASMFGYTSDELVGLAVEVLVPPDAVPDHVAARRRFVHEGRTRPMAAPGYDIEGLRRDGTRMPVDVQLSPLADGLVLVVVRDASEARARAAELALVRADLTATRRREAAHAEALDGVVQHVFGATTQLHAIRQLAPDAAAAALDRCITALHHALDVGTAATTRAATTDPSRPPAASSAPPR
jgi:PAS domain S-box-containing protein